MHSIFSRCHAGSLQVNLKSCLLHYSSPTTVKEVQQQEVEEKRSLVESLSDSPSSPQVLFLSWQVLRKDLLDESLDKT